MNLHRNVRDKVSEDRCVLGAMKEEAENTGGEERRGLPEIVWDYRLGRPAAVGAIRQLLDPLSCQRHSPLNRF